MRRAIAIVNQTPALQPMFEELEAIHAQAQERVNFMTRQVEKLKQDLEPKTKAVWARIEEHCESTGLLKRGQKHDLHYDKEVSLLYTKEGEDEKTGFAEMLSKLFT